MLNPQFVAGEHGLFGGHKSEDIRTFFKCNFAFRIFISNVHIHISVYVCIERCHNTFECNDLNKVYL